MELFFGLCSHFLVSAESDQFSVDLSSNLIIVGTDSFTCNASVGCTIESTDILTDSYKNQRYDYQQAKMFINWDPVSPAVVSSLEQSQYLEAFHFRNVHLDGHGQGTPSVLQQSIPRQTECNFKALEMYSDSPRNRHFGKVCAARCLSKTIGSGLPCGICRTTKSCKSTLKFPSRFR